MYMEKKTTGRKICDALKQVRLQIARAGGIDYTPRECSHQGECLGTCPACEAEKRQLEDSLRAKWGNKFATRVAGVAVVAGALSLTSCGKPQVLQGDVPMRDTTHTSQPSAAKNVKGSETPAQNAKKDDDEEEIMVMGIVENPNTADTTGTCEEP